MLGLIIMLGLVIAMFKVGLGIAIKGIIFLWVLSLIFKIGR